MTSFPTWTNSEPSIFALFSDMTSLENMLKVYLAKLNRLKTLLYKKHGSTEFKKTHELSKHQKIYIL